jgi:hypothetical protein
MGDIYSGPKYSDLQLNMDKTQVVEKKRGDKATLKKYGVVSLIFSIVYTFCLYENHSGITYPIFMIMTLGLLHLLRKRDGLSLITSKNGNKALSIFYVLSLTLLSVHKCISTSWALLYLDTVAIILLFFSFVLYLYVDTTGWDIVEWIAGILLTLINPFFNLFKPFFDFFDWSKSRGGEMSKEKKQTINAITIGAACAIPALIIIVSLLSSADIVFNRLLEKIAESIHLPDNFEDVVGIIFTLCFAFIFSYLIPYVLEKGEVNIAAKGEGKGNPVIAITFTAIIGVVYLVFCLIQVMFLFTNSVRLPAGYTYATYAHEGFYQLLAVCILNVIMVSVCAREFKKSKLLSFILLIIGVCTYVMIASSAMRMIMYIRVYNLTFLRLFVLWFLTVLCFWLSFLLVGVFNRKFPVFKACMTVITVAYIGFVFSNPDYQIAKYDLAAVEKSDKVDKYGSVEQYILDSLSTDAAPALAENQELLHKFDIYITSRYRHEEEKYDGIRSFNFSYYRAQKLFNGAKKVGK